MQRLMQVNVQVTEPVYLKDPQATELGRRILEQGVRMIDELGLEAFTFGKLAAELSTAESSIYRYFENKHRLLIYLIGWYWSWREYKLAFDTANIADHRERLGRAIRSITEPVTERGNFAYLDLRALYRIAVSESAKAYMTKGVDTEHREGCFGSFKRICDRLKEHILSVDPAHPFPAMLASNVVDGSMVQRFFAEHLPSLTEKQARAKLSELFVELVFATMNKKNQ
ncbi:MAG: TetR/AcrR family transcriptional regulator [Flavobacteriales bacterium]|jgi:AcrR family transcriptional regulator|nr:TetR/AcrR family transcriptional regulator [Flavobacteriales bacterium]